MDGHIGAPGGDRVFNLQGYNKNCSVWAEGYEKKNGTYPHYCSTLIKFRTDNYNYPGVYQPSKRRNIYNVYDC